VDALADGESGDRGYQQHSEEAGFIPAILLRVAALRASAKTQSTRWRYTRELARALKSSA